MAPSRTMMRSERVLVSSEVRSFDMVMLGGRMMRLEGVYCKFKSSYRDMLMGVVQESEKPFRNLLFFHC